MNRKILFAILFCLLATSILVLVSVIPSLSVHSVKAFETIYISADGTVSPSSAPIQRIGDFYVLNADILSEGNGIVINRSSVILDGASHSLEGSGKGTGISLASLDTIESPHNIDNVTILNLTITHFEKGLYLYYSSNDTITRNNIVENGEGIRVEYGMYAPVGIVFNENNVVRNSVGISLDETAHNSFFHNNFANNTVQVFCEICLASYSKWDKGYPQGGNYWSNYNGTDVKSGKDQNETGHDGIGDTAYRDDSLIELDVSEGPMGLRDNYPLMNPWTS